MDWLGLLNWIRLLVSNVGLDWTLGLVWTYRLDSFELSRQNILVCESKIIISSLMSQIQEFKSTSQRDQSNPRVHSIGPVKQSNPISVKSHPYLAPRVQFSPWVYLINPGVQYNLIQVSILVNNLHQESNLMHESNPIQESNSVQKFNW